MTSRRTVLQAGVGLPLIMAVQQTGFAATRGAHRTVVAVVDTRLAGSESFAAVMSDAGAAVLLRIRGDVTPVWMHLMAQRKRLAETVLIGLTTEQSLFCLDQMTRSEGLRIVHRDASTQAATGAWRQAGQRTVALPLQHGPVLREGANVTLSSVGWAIARPGTKDLA